MYLFWTHKTKYMHQIQHAIYLTVDHESLRVWLFVHCDLTYVFLLVALVCLECADENNDFINVY
jgi:hypothetical protein